MEEGKEEKFVRGPASKPNYKIFVKDIRIPMRDGVKLYAKGWFPESREPLPVVINYDSYRSSDMRTMSRGNFFHYLAIHGFIVVHLGGRGTDGSEGTVVDEYPLQEQLDGYDAVEWLAAQDWSNSNIGMIGTSYAGFTAVQVAMHQPPHLKAIVPLYATDDRYTDDVHYSGGTLDSIFDVTNWATMMVSLNALPPPETITEYEKIWEEHLEGNIPYQLNWLEHQTNDEYWRPASLRPNYDKIKCAVYIIGAWYDWYRNCAVRMYKKLEAPRKLLQGPWEHVFPDWGHPGAPINFMPQVVRWFDHWLKGIDTGMMDEPTLTTFMRSMTDPKPEDYPNSGYWREEYFWPNSTEFKFFFGMNRSLVVENSGNGSDSFEYKPSVGIGYPTWEKIWTSGSDEDRKYDLENSLVYDTEPVQDTIEILGRPVLQFHFSSDAPQVNIVAKLFDVAPDGTLDPFTFGVLNSSHRESHTELLPLTPEERVKITLELDATSWILKKDHSLKLVLAGSSFPHTWPSPYLAKNTIWWGNETPSSLAIPVVSSGDPTNAPNFGPIQMPLDVYKMETTPTETEIIHKNHQSTFKWKTSHFGKLSEDNVEFQFDEHSSFTVSDENPGNAIAESTQDISRKTSNNHSRAVTFAKLESTKEIFTLSYKLVVTLNGKEKTQKSWEKSFKRVLV